MRVLSLDSKQTKKIGTILFFCIINSMENKTLSIYDYNDFRKYLNNYHKARQENDKDEAKADRI